MPEGDTVYRTATKLREALVGRVLTRCDIRVPRYAAVDLTGEHVDEVLSRGKHLFIRIGAASIHSHLKMDGSWVIGSFRGPQHRIRIVLGTADTVAFGVDLGVLEVLERANDQDAVAHLGPDLLGPDWDPQLAKHNLVAEPDRELADVLLDQRVMAGVGNVYANELCFVIGKRPDSPVREVPDPLRVVQRARDMLWLNRNRANRIITGNTRRGQQFWVYGRAAEPCRRCRTPIRRDDSGDRIRYWCPNCQR
ncbi:MAG: endonuclease VIII Nei2 [Mycolicibacterium neoaurum]|uniref:endonuclease VIII Nei2 n=1 Tax=Mycolicibacterium neoaurum TaxID=1795 RepID=UPI002FF75FB3